MRRAFAAVLLLAVAARGEEGARLDPAARIMLQPVRAEGLRPAELIARLAIAPDATVADVGAGPGFLTLPLARAVPRGRVIATDVRADHLAIAAERAASAGLTNVATRVVPPDAPSLAAGTIDLALLCQVDQYLPDRARYFSQLATALVPRGRIALVNWTRFREEDLVAARAAGLTVVDQWSPSQPFFLLVLQRAGDAGAQR